MIPATPEELARLVKEWEDIKRDEHIDIEINKPNGQDGRALRMRKPVPALIESFLLFANVSTTEWTKLRNDPRYSAYDESAQRVSDFCNANIMMLTALGYITDNMGKFYLVNNSRYKDVSEVIQTTTTKVLPAWITKRVEIEEANKPKGLPHESIPFIDVSNNSIDDLL